MMQRGCVIFEQLFDRLILFFMKEEELRAYLMIEEHDQWKTMLSSEDQNWRLLEFSHEEQWIRWEIEVEWEDKLDWLELSLATDALWEEQVGYAADLIRS